MHTLSEAVEHQAISCPAHCLLRQSGRLLERRGHPSAWFRTMKREARQSHATGRRHPKQALVIRGAEITSVDRRLSCTPSGPVAQNSRDNSGTRPLDQFRQLGAKWQQRPPGPALISRIHTSSGHHAPHQCSDSAEEWIRPGSNHPPRGIQHRRQAEVALKGLPFARRNETKRQAGCPPATIEFQQASTHRP